MAFSVPTNQSTGSSTQHDILMARTIATGLSDVEPEVKRELQRLYGWDLGLGDWMEEKGAMYGIKNRQTFHKEKYAIRQDFSVEAVTLGAATGTLTVVSGNRVATSETQPPYIGTGSRTTLPVRAQDIIEFPNRVQALVTEITNATAGTFVVHTVDGSDVPALTTSDKIRVITNAMPESPDSVTSRFTFGQGFTSVLQTIRDTETISDQALATQDWFTNLGSGQNSNMYYSEALIDTYNNHKNSRDLTWLASKQITNTALANVSGQETTMTTEGYIPWLESNANVESYSAGQFSLDEIDYMIAKVTKYRGSREYEVWCELTLSRQIDDFLRAETGLNNGGVIYSSTDKQKYIDFGFKSMTRSGITFHFNRLPAFNYDEYLGGVGYEGMGLMMPVGNESVEVEGSQIKVPLCELLYQGSDDYDSAGYAEWVHGGFSSGRTNGVANRVYEVQSCIGFRGIGGNRHGIFKVSAS